MRNHEASIHNLETQVGQIAKILSERNPGSLLENTETNLKEHVNAVVLRSGKELPPVVQEDKKPKLEEPSEEYHVSKGKEKQVENATDAKCQPPHEVPEYKPTIPYPARLKKDKADEQYGRFLEIFKQLHINLLLVEALS